MDKKMRIQKFNGKESDEYKYWANDFLDHRFVQWSSVWFQASECIINENIESVIEFGSGRDTTKALVEHFGVKHLSVDISSRFYPDVVSSIENFATDETYDMVMCFQCLEHNSYDLFSSYLQKFKKLSNKYILISVPYSGRWLSFSLNINLPGIHMNKIFCFPFERFNKRVRPVNEFEKRENKHSAHWWEVGDKLTTKKRVRKEIISSGLKIVSEFHNPLFPYHYFYMMEV